MVQFFRGSPDPRDAALGRLGEALGMGIGQKINTHFANKAIDEVLEDESLANAQPSEKMGRLQRALSPYGQMGQQLLKQRLEIEQQQAEQEQDVLSRLVSGEKLSPKEISALSSSTQMRVMRYQQQQEEANKKINADTLASTAFSKGYKAILDDDVDSLKEIISDPNTPLNVKTQLSNIQNKLSTRNDVKAREARSRVNSVQNAYSRAIAAERNRIGKIGGLRKNEIEEINQRIAFLEKERQQDMQQLLKNPEAYASLSIWGNDQMRSYLPEENPIESVDEGVENQEAEPPGQRKEKIKLATDDDRKNAARELLRKHGGDKQAAMREFEETYE